MNGTINFEDIYRNNIKLVRKIIHDFNITNGMADDLAQQTFLKVFEKISSLRDKNLMSAWIGTIARNYCLVSFRSRQFVLLEESHEDGLATFNEYQLGLWFDPESGLADLELEESLGMLSQLLVEYKKEPRGRVARLYYLEGKTTKEIALELAMSQNTVLSHLLLFRREMKTALIAMSKSKSSRPLLHARSPEIPSF